MYRVHKCGTLEKACPALTQLQFLNFNIKIQELCNIIIQKELHLLMYQINFGGILRKIRQFYHKKESHVKLSSVSIRTFITNAYNFKRNFILIQ